MIKEVLEENNIPAASILYQRPSRAKRRCIKTVGVVTFPMYPTVKHGRQKLSEHIVK